MVSTFWRNYLYSPKIFVIFPFLSSVRTRSSLSPDSSQSISFVSVFTPEALVMLTLMLSVSSSIHKTRKGESEFGLTNTNKLIKWYEGATGLKTGSTGKALYCLSGTAERNGLHLIGVVMAAPDFKLRFQETMKLLDYGFANYSAEKGLPAGKEMGRIPVTKGMKDSVSTVVQEEISILLKKDIGGEWETKAELLPAMDAPVAAGEKVGELIYLLHGKEVGRTDLITAEAVEKANINTMLQRMLRQWF